MVSMSLPKYGDHAPVFENSVVGSMVVGCFVFIGQTYGQVSHYYVIFFVLYITVISFAVIRVISAVPWDATRLWKTRLERKTFGKPTGDMEGKFEEVLFF